MKIHPKQHRKAHVAQKSCVVTIERPADMRRFWICTLPDGKAIMVHEDHIGEVVK